MPTFSHLALARGCQTGLFKSIVTSNHDGLHQKASEAAGSPDIPVIDIFGNAYLEKCLKCSSVYYRRVITPNIGRTCDNLECKGRLMKCGTRMGAMTPAEPLAAGVEQARQADVALVLGSSMTVTPFCDLPMMARHTVLVTRQETSFDRDCLCIHANCDVVMRAVAEWFDFTMTGFNYVQHYQISLEPSEQGDLKEDAPIRYQFLLRSSRFNEPPRFVEEVFLTVGDGKEKEVDSRSDGCFEGDLMAKFGSEVRVRVVFQAGYGVPEHHLILVCGRENVTSQYTMTKFIM
eukprot:TRINITY_DN7040_c0_g1_i3.p1 TRINITY_DN7040_c0_g1~~TRINITY_DN7040_c0_g1_i3.p1  ORF type:complete len:290 (-),score=42.71 TRINITY_DN7040_c0_g1_i3:74-943(-)